MSDAALHCPHAAGMAVCVADGSTEAAMFCDGYFSTCGMYNSFMSVSECRMTYDATPAGTAGATSGDSQACRDYHLGAAMSDAMLHCPHAGGEEVCVADETTMMPTTTMDGNAAAMSFCTVFMSVCAEHNTWADADDSMMACVMAFTATPEGDQSDTFGFTQGCRVYHLGAAVTGPALHCPHAGSEAVCVSDESAAFCDDYTDACLDHDAFDGDIASCIAQYEMVPMGTTGATTGNSRACRAYHINLALTDPATHCEHSAGLSVCVDGNAQAQAFCAQYMNTCSMYDSFSGDMAMCVMSYDNTPMGSAGATSGNSQACRDYHLGAAMSDAGLHCPHAGGEAVCVDDVADVTTTAMVTTTAAAFTCPRNCGTPARGGGTCRPNGRCTSCNSNRIRQSGTCLSSISCRASRILTGRLAGNGCRCANSHCHYCVRQALGDECRKCRVRMRPFEPKIP